MAYTIAAALLWAKKNLPGHDFVLDTEILLAHVLQKPRSYLLAFSEKELSSQEMHAFQQLIAQRKEGVPVAYLVGHQEFWSLDFRVTPDVLIPRPETELLVEQVLQHVQGENQIIADLGTGSGAIALALAHENPTWEIHATDVSANALHVAKQNAARLQCQHVHFHQGSWCAALPQIQFAAIVSNPPYIAQNDEYIEPNTVRYEPHTALFAEEQGLFAIRQIIAAARGYLLPNGYLMLEHGFQQAGAVYQLFEKYHYVEIAGYQDLAGRDRVTIAKKT